MAQPSHHKHPPHRHEPLGWRLFRTFYRGLGKGVLASLLLAAALAMGAAYFILNLAFTPDKLSPRVKASLEAVLNHRQVSIESTRILPWQGIRVSGVRVKEREGFSGGDFLSCQLVVVRYSLLALLEGRFELEEISFWSPTIQVERSASGEWNIADLGRRTGQIAPEFRLVAIHDGEVELADRLRSRTAALRRMDLTLEGRAWTQSLPFSLAFDFKEEGEGKSVEGRAEAAGSVKGLGQGLKDAYVDFGSAHVQVPGAGLRASGTVRRFGAPLVDLRWRLSGLDPAKLEPLVRLPPALRLRDASGELHGSLESLRRFDIRSLRLLAGGLDLKLAGALDLGASPPALRLHLLTNRFSMEEASRFWAGLEPYGLKGRSEWKLDLSGDLSDVSLDRLAISMSGAAGRTSKASATAGQLDLSVVSNLKNASARVSDGSLEGSGQKLSSVKGSAELSGDELRIKDADGLWNGVHFHFRSRVQRPLAPRLVSLEGDLAPIGLDQLVASIQALTRTPGAQAPRAAHSLAWLRMFRQTLPRQFPDLKGDLRLARIDHPNVTGQNVSLVYDLGGVKRGMKELRGSVIVDLRAGRVRDYPALMQHPFLRYVFLPFETLEKMSQMGYFSSRLKKDLPYERIHGDYRFSKGSMRIDRFFIDGPEITATAEGEVDWVGEKLKLHVITRVNHSGMGAPETLSDDKGRPTLAFYIEGPMLRPGLRIDLKKVESGAIERFMQAGLKESEANAALLRKDLW